MDDPSTLPNDVGWPINIIFWILIDLPRLLWADFKAGDLGISGDFYTSIFIISSIVSGLLIFGCGYALVKLWQIRTEEEYALKHPDVAEVVEKAPEVEGRIGALKWQVVEKHISSNNPSDWRLAILEADILLDDMVRGFGYPGINLGERLKSADRSTFATLDEAWEAHKIRNAIAHEGAGFELGEREAKRVINLYRTVFEEANYI